MIVIKGLDKAKVLAALFNAAKQLSPGHNDVKQLSEAEAEALIGSRKPGDAVMGFAKKHGYLYFDQIHARSLKVDLTEDELDIMQYDIENGPGAAALALAPLFNPKQKR